MKKVLNGIDKVVGFIATYLCGLYTLLIFLLVLYTVLCRYVLHINTGGIDEFTTYFVVCSVWVGAILCSRDVKSGQIKIDFLRNYVKNKKVMAVIDMVWQVISIAAMAIFTKLCWDYFFYHVIRGSVLSGIRFPMAVFSGTMMVSCALITIYEVRKFIVEIRDLIQLGKKKGGID